MNFNFGIPELLIALPIIIVIAYLLRKSFIK